MDNTPKVYNDVINSYTSGGNITMTSNLSINTTTVSLNTSSGALTVNGGVGINGNIYTNNIYSNNLLLTPNSVTTKGDLFVFSTINDRLPSSTNGSVLISDSTVPLGVRWSNSSNLFMVYTNDYYLVKSTNLSGTTSNNFVLKTSLTTGSLSSGTYNINIGYWIASNTTNGSNYQIDVYLNANNTTGTLIHRNIGRPSQTSLNSPYYDSITQTFGNSIANVGLWYRNAINGNTTNISNAFISVERIQ